MEDMIFKLIANVGVPAAMAIVVLVNVSKSIDRLETTLNRHNAILVAILAKLGHDDGVEEMLENCDCTAKK